MQIPIDLDKISTLLAISAFILFITYEFVIPYFGRTRILVLKARVRRSTIIMGALFFFTVVIKIMQILLT